MITLNLLSPEKKEDIRLSGLYLAIKNLIILILLFTIITAIVLLLSKLILQNHFNRIVEQTTLTTKIGSVFNKDIKSFNLELSSVAKIQKDNVVWSEFLISFYQLVPDNISLYSLEIEEVTSKEGLEEMHMIIRGLARTRNKLLNLKENMDASNMFLSPEIPLDSLLKKEDINFTLTTKINMVKLKPKSDE